MIMNVKAEDGAELEDCSKTIQILLVNSRAMVLPPTLYLNVRVLVKSSLSPRLGGLSVLDTNTSIERHTGGFNLVLYRAPP